MNSRPGRRRRVASLIICTLTVFGVFLALTAVSLASTSRASAPKRATSRHRTKKPKKRPAPKPLTQAQILKIIKQDEKPGPPGATGATGPAGANGAVAGYSAAGSGGALNGTVTVVSKALPPGIYIVHAKVVMNATAGQPGIAAGECDLLKGSTTIDTALWSSPLSALSNLPNVYLAASTLPMEAGLSMNTAATVSVQCLASGPDTAALTASNVQLQAVQVNTAA